MGAWTGYDLYLDAAFAATVSSGVGRLRNAARPRGRTALIITTDHGRGATGPDWPSHGAKVPGADKIWIAALGPGVAPLGVRKNTSVTQSQVAATIARLVGQDYSRAGPKAALPLPLQ